MAIYIVEYNPSSKTSIFVLKDKYIAFAVLWFVLASLLILTIMFSIVFLFLFYYNIELLKEVYIFEEMYNILAENSILYNRAPFSQLQYSHLATDLRAVVQYHSRFPDSIIQFNQMWNGVVSCETSRIMVGDYMNNSVFGWHDRFNVIPAMDSTALIIREDGSVLKSYFFELLESEAERRRR
jgi:hypothetical protein